MIRDGTEVAKLPSATLRKEVKKQTIAESTAVKNRTDRFIFHKIPQRETPPLPIP